MLPFMPVQFTSVLTAVVWIFAGIQYALVFTVLGTFRLDSIPIFTGIQSMVRVIAPQSFIPFSEPITVLLMFSGNLATAYFFKKVFAGKLSRIRPIQGGSSTLDPAAHQGADSTESRSLLP